MSEPNSSTPSFSPGHSALLPQAALPAAPPAPAMGRAVLPAVATSAAGVIASGANQPPVIDESRVDWIETLQGAPPWLVSLVIHMLVLICLGLMVASLKEVTKVNIEAVYGDDKFAEEIGDQLDKKNPFDLSTDKPDLNATETEFSPVDLPPVEHPLAVPPLGASPLATSYSMNGRIAGGTEGIDAPIGIALHGRERGYKKVLLGKYGGTKTTEAAVQAALVWLKKNQRTNGLWTLNGPYSDGGEAENRVAATALALLAFQGNGNTQLANADTDHDYKPTIKKAWDALLKLQTSEGQFIERGVPLYHTMYTHAQATIALCELYGMTHDSSYRAPAERAIRFLVKSQDAAGGWRYTPGNDSDMSVTGWCVMALQSALMAGLEVPSNTLQNVNRFLDSVQDGTGSHYHYHPGNYVNHAMTAEGLLCRQYLGWKQDDPQLIKGVQFLAAEPINSSETNVYYWYYATQVMHHMGGSYWTHWNDVMRQMIPESQVRKGPEEGSWDPGDDKYAGQGGRLYVTCLRTFMLEVYYRHLPIYGDIYKEPESTASKEEVQQ